jgi:tetratricopeptide (TPR) repeat protein
MSKAQIKSQGDLDLNLDFAKACIITGSETEKAKETLLEISKNYPQRYDALGLLGEAYELTQEYELALESYQKALNTQLRDNPEWSTKLSLGLGRVSLKLGQPDIAITTLKSALVSNNDDIDVHRTLSDAYLAADLKEKSLSAAKSALNLDSDDEPNIDWYIQQAITLDATDKAIEALKELQQRDPNRSSILTKLGWLYLYEGDAETALNTFNQAKTIDNISPIDLYKVSQGFLAINEPENAIECLDKAIYMSESTPETEEWENLYSTKSTAQQMIGDLEGAIKTIDESLLRIDKKPEIIKKKTKILSDLDRFDEAIVCLEDGIKDFPTDDELIIQSIGLYRASGDLRTAAKHAVSLLRLPKESSMGKMDQSTAAIISDLADALLQTKLAKEIIDNTQSVDIDTDQLDLAYYCSLTKLSLDADEDIAAADAITSALKIDPKHPRVLALQARLTSRQGDFKAAEQILIKGLMATGNFPQLIGSRLTTGDLANLSIIEHPVSTFIELADVCMKFQHWSVAIFLLQKAIALAPNEPRSHFNYARALVLRAEHQRLCQSLDVVNNSPGKSTIEEYAYKRFEDAILKAAHLITEIITPIDSEKSQNIEPKSKIAKWLARGQAIFQPSKEHAQALANLNISPDNQTAYIAALRYCDDFSGAIKTSKNLYQESEKQIADPNLLCQIALCLLKDSPEIAAEAIGNAIKISNWLNSPNGPIYYAIQAEVARNMGAFELQLQALESALAFWSNEPNWLSVAADLHLNQPHVNNQSVAIQYLEHAASLQPKNFNNHLKLAQVFKKANSPKDVVRVLENATNVIPKRPEPWLALARAYQQNGDIPQSIRSAKMVVQIDPSQPEAYLLLANVALEVDNPEKSFKYIDNILSKDPENAQALLLRSRTYQALGKSQEALNSLEIAIPNLPKSILIQLERIGLIREAKGEENALVALNRLNDENPDNPQILAALSEVLSKTGQQEAAIQTALDALPEARLEMQKSELVKLLQLLGRLLRKSGQLDQAIHNLSEAIDLSPQDSTSYLDLGRCYQDQRQYDRALQNFNTAINLAPDSPQAYYFSGIIYKDTKDYENAEHMFKKAAKYAPDDLNIHRQLGAVTAINLVHNRLEQPDISLPTESMES